MQKEKIYDSVNFTRGLKFATNDDQMKVNILDNKKTGSFLLNCQHVKYSQENGLEALCHNTNYKVDLNQCIVSNSNTLSLHWNEKYESPLQKCDIIDSYTFKCEESENELQLMTVLTFKDGRLHCTNEE